MLNKTNFEIAKLCPKKDGFKYTMHGIRVTPDATTVVTGHSLLKISGVGPGEHFDPFILPANVALKVAAAVPSGPDIPALDEASIEHIEGEANVSISIRSDEDMCRDVYNTQSLNGPFPDINKVIPDVKGAAVEVMLDLDLLIPLLERIRKFHGKQQRGKASRRRFATFRFYKGDAKVETIFKAQRIDAKNDLGQELTAAIMPCRG